MEKKRYDLLHIKSYYVHALRTLKRCSLVAWRYWDEIILSDGAPYLTHFNTGITRERNSSRAQSPSFRNCIRVSIHKECEVTSWNARGFINWYFRPSRPVQYRTTKVQVGNNVVIENNKWECLFTVNYCRCASGSKGTIVKGMHAIISNLSTPNSWNTSAVSTFRNIVNKLWSQITTNSINLWLRNCVRAFVQKK